MDGSCDMRPVDASGQAKTPQQNRFLNATYARLLSGVLIGSFLLGGVVWWTTKPDRDAENARSKALSAFMAQVKKDTGSGIYRKGDESNLWYGYHDGAYKISLQVGTCEDVRGAVQMPQHPKASDKIGPLWVEIAGRTDGAPKSHTVINTTSANWAKPFLEADSGMKHCFPEK